VESGLKRKWPRNLAVKRLELIGSLNVNDIERLSTINCELELDLDCVGAENMYLLLELKGSLVKTLVIGNTNNERRDVDYVKSEIILERILSACPKLENFEYKTSRTVVQDDEYDMQPSAFKNYQRYDLN
jgi:hypothetical protein